LALYLSKMVPVGFFAARAVNGSSAAVTRERSFMVGRGGGCSPMAWTGQSERRQASKSYVVAGWLSWLAGLSSSCRLLFLGSSQVRHGMGRKADSPMFIAPASHNNKQASVNTAIHPSILTLLLPALRPATHQCAPPPNTTPSSHTNRACHKRIHYTTWLPCLPQCIHNNTSKLYTRQP